MIVGVALLLIERGKMLFVHTRNSRYLFHPGGVKKPGESVAQTLHRELKRELGVELHGVYQFGKVCGKTSTGKPLELHLFRASLAGTPQVNRESSKLLWLTRREAECSGMMTKITEEQTLPLLAMCAVW